MICINIHLHVFQGLINKEDCILFIPKAKSVAYSRNEHFNVIIRMKGEGYKSKIKSKGYFSF